MSKQITDATIIDEYHRIIKKIYLLGQRHVDEKVSHKSKIFKIFINEKQLQSKSIRLYCLSIRCEHDTKLLVLLVSTGVNTMNAAF